ncbi:MAG TPA: DUF177 domain-containing protein [Acidobacteriota bacterium]
MRIDIDRLPKEGLKVDRDFDFLSEDLVEEDAVFLQPAHARLEIKKVDQEILIKGRLTVGLSFVCSRCLMPFDYPVDSAFDLVYQPEDLEQAKEELAEEDLERGYFYSRSLDLQEIILEQLNLTFPVKPLCSKDCGGICPICGKVRRESGCACTVREDDFRPVKIKNLIKS